MNSVFCLLPPEPGYLLSLTILFFASVAFFWLIYNTINYPAKKYEKYQRKRGGKHIK